MTAPLRYHDSLDEYRTPVYYWIDCGFIVCNCEFISPALFPNPVIRNDKRGYVSNWLKNASFHKTYFDNCFYVGLLNYDRLPLRTVDVK